MPVLLFSGLEPYWQAPSVVGWRQREMLYKSFFPPDYQVGQMLSSFPFNASGEPGLQHVQHHWGSTFQYPLIINGPFKGGGEDTDLIGAEAPVTPKKMQITMFSCIFFINESKSKTYLTDSTPLYFRPGVKGYTGQFKSSSDQGHKCFDLFSFVKEYTVDIVGLPRLDQREKPTCTECLPFSRNFSRWVREGPRL